MFNKGNDEGLKSKEKSPRNIYCNNDDNNTRHRRNKKAKKTDLPVTSKSKDVPTDHRTRYKQCWKKKKRKK